MNAACGIRSALSPQDMVVDLETQLVKRKISVIVGARASVQDCSTCRYNVEVGLLAWL